MNPYNPWTAIEQLAGYVDQLAGSMLILNALIAVLGFGVCALAVFLYLLTLRVRDLEAAQRRRRSAEGVAHMIPAPRFAIGGEANAERFGSPAAWRGRGVGWGG